MLLSSSAEEPNPANCVGGENPAKAPLKMCILSNDMVVQTCRFDLVIYSEALRHRDKMAEHVRRSRNKVDNMHMDLTSRVECIT